MLDRHHGVARVDEALEYGEEAGGVDAAHAALHQERESLRAASKALEALARDHPAALPSSGLRIGEVAALIGVRTSALRVWEAAGLITPDRERGTKYRVYSPADVRDARLIHTLRRNHYLLDQIRPVLEGLRREGSTEALRAAVGARGEALTARTHAMLEGAGALYSYLSTVA
ncbi:DNA-binding transcriptional MerR regulator [Streptomyces sp. LBL]|nr:DNA-binding transcriptional MerR regulator [Streptomyces sp. LBL]